eukprot:CAMPEP_0171212422 /NCGR_PEP_ID=MMETSP0790-20130122/30124_1 /TAXON_ID=2925 /ORGANISM="Alexandrium catenella, Strain OF101" /LENGTH=90 /DNA_ID=CAMNT_0011678105 /DNA_START=246 /DNA_END=518 /DNA_ORIENTATION=+
MKYVRASRLGLGVVLCDIKKLVPLVHNRLPGKVGEVEDTDHTRSEKNERVPRLHQGHDLLRLNARNMVVHHVPEVHFVLLPIPGSSLIPV